MLFDTQWSLPVVLIVGLAALYVWYLMEHATITERVFAYPREHWGPLWGCPWCAGFWVVGLLLVLQPDFYDPYTHLAAAAVGGFMGSRV